MLIRDFNIPNEDIPFLQDVAAIHLNEAHEKIDTVCDDTKAIAFSLAVNLQQRFVYPECDLLVKMLLESGLETLSDDKGRLAVGYYPMDDKTRSLLRELWKTSTQSAANIRKQTAQQEPIGIEYVCTPT